jgi:hypothetical protein
VTLSIDPAPARVVFWIAVACCAIAQLLIVRGAWRTPPAGEAADGIPRPSRAAEIAWTILPGIVLAVIFALTWRALPGNAAGATPADGRVVAAELSAPRSR